MSDETSTASTKKSIEDLNIGGKKTACTRKQFDKQIEGKLRAQCILKNVGTFYFVFGGVSREDSQGRHKVYLKFYNDEEGVVHKSAYALFICPRDHQGFCHAIDQNTFMLESFMISMNEDWTKHNFIPMGPQDKTAFAAYLSDQTDVHKTGLSRIKRTADSDFTLESGDGETVAVHRSVMEGLWPFFKGMVDSNMEETSNKRVKLSMPKSTMDVLVRYLYGEELSLQFEDAANLIVYAQMYNLPELLDIATTEVKSVAHTIQQAIYLWCKAFEAKNEDVRGYSAGKIEGLIPKTSDFNGEIESLEKSEVVSLFSDVAVAMAK